GRVVGAKLDRNGLRPLRYTRTSDGWIVAGSEAGIVDFANEKIVERQRLGPGEMLMVDISSGALVRNRELLRCISSEAARRPRCRENVNVAATWGTDAPVAEAERIAAAVGWSEDQVRFLLHPLAEGKEAVWSMGDDTPPAFLSRMRLRRTLWDYCKQRFAQVTNPPIDPLREAHVMSVKTCVGQQFSLASPLVSEGQLQCLRNRLEPCLEIDATIEAARGISGALQALDGIRSKARRSGEGPRMVLLSDRVLNAERVALPILLAAATVWKE